MATITISPSGINGGMSGGNEGKAGRRGNVIGWTVQSARGNERFLKSIDFDLVPPFGAIATLTVRHCPPCFSIWQGLVKAQMRYISRLPGFVAAHYVTEWTKAARPHLHVLVIFDNRDTCAFEIKSHWLKLSAPFGTLDRAQHVVQLDLARRISWLAYVAKHAARGAGHYQRERELIPEGWEKTGRMWGKLGDWPTRSRSVQIPDYAFHRFRRLHAARARSDARTELRNALRFGDPRSIKNAMRRVRATRRLLKCNKASASRVRGIGGFVPEHVSEGMLNWIIQDLRLVPFSEC